MTPPDRRHQARRAGDPQPDTMETRVAVLEVLVFPLDDELRELRREVTGLRVRIAWYVGLASGFGVVVQAGLQIYLNH